MPQCNGLSLGEKTFSNMFFINVPKLKLKILILFVALINDSDVFLMGCSSMELSSWKGRPLLYLSDPRTCRFSRSPGHCLPKWSLAVLWHFSRKKCHLEGKTIAAGAAYWVSTLVPYSVQLCLKVCKNVRNCAKFCKIVQNRAQLHCLCISAEPMGSLKKPKGGIANDHSIGSLVFCPLDASS